MNKPPKYANKLLLLFLKDELAEEVCGDLQEKFERMVEAKSPGRARRNYWFQVFNYLRPFAIRKVARTTRFKMNLSLLRNYILIALRVFRVNPGHTSINVLGLAIAVSCSFFMYLWVEDEWKHNRFLTDGDRVANVLNRETQTNGEVHTYRYSPYQLKGVLESEYPIVEQATILSNGNWMAFELGDELVEWQGVDATPEFFEMFETTFVKGGYEEMFENADAIAISTSFASTYFGENWQKQDIIGTTMNNDDGEVKQLIGIYEDFPKHSTMQHKFVVPFRNRFGTRPNLLSWNNSSSQLYVKLKEGVSIADANSKLVNAIIDHRDGDTLVEREVFLQLFKDMYLYNRLENGTIAGGRIEYVRLLSIAAVFILLLACINFMNITTARSSHRLKETGVRKVLGARRANLRHQFLVESILTSLFAVCIAVLIVYVLKEPFDQLTDKEIADQIFTLKHVSYALCFILVIGVLSGIYPAFILSSIRINESLKGALSSSGKSAFFRKSLVIVQFSITMIMITGAITVYRQVSYIQNKNIGLDRSNLLRSYTYDMDPNKDYQRYKETLLSKPGVESVALVTQLLIDVRNATSGVSWEGKLETDDLEFYTMDANPDFLATARIELKEGRNFSWDLQSDTSNYIINEAAQKLMGMKDPVGKKMEMWGIKGRIVGVVKDFHNASLHSDIKPLIIRNKMRWAWMVMVRAKEGQQQEAIASLEEVFYEFNKNRTFWVRFVDDLFDSQYKSELLVKDLSRLFTVIAIVISLLGLFSLVIYNTERRTKEVGIRKVLGASIAQIFQLLSKEYAFLILISMLIGIPICFFAMTQWLNGFAYLAPLSWWLFAVGGFISFGLAYLVIAYSTAKAALSNPITHLRDE